MLCALGVTIVHVCLRVCLQEDNDIPVHLKGGVADAVLYRATMVLTVLGEALEQQQQQLFLAPLGRWSGGLKLRESVEQRHLLLPRSPVAHRAPSFLSHC